MRQATRGSSDSPRFLLPLLVWIFGGMATVLSAQVGFPPEIRSPEGETTVEGAKGFDGEGGSRLAGHRENYVLAVTYADDPNGNVGGFREVKHLELKFQLSLRYRIVDLGPRNGKVVFGYTNTSFWQVYNWRESAPFRTTDHQPEFFYEWRVTEEKAPTPRRYGRLGVVHQSNGEGVRLSRSWNRLLGEYLVAWIDKTASKVPGRSGPVPGKYASVKAWWKFQGDEAHNADIDEYMGNFELRGEWVCGGRLRSRLMTMLRNNLRVDGNRGAVQVDFSFGLPWRWEDLRLRLQYFNGYGESLIDYNHNSNRIGFGLELTY